MKDGQKEIYYIVGEDPKSVLRSPHLDYFHSQGTEVLLLTDPMGNPLFMLMGLHKYKDFDLKNVAQAEVDTKEKPGKDQPEAEKIPDADFNSLIEIFKKVLGERVTDARASNRLYQSVARLADADANANPELQRVYKYLGKEMKSRRRCWN